MGKKVTQGAALKDEQQESLPAFLKAKGSNSCSLSVHAKPGAKTCGLVLGAEAVDVTIDAPAREGEANAAILEYVAGVLGLKKRDVTLAAGGKSREKVLLIEGLDAATALARLQAGQSS